jgi:hypothetical protein
MEPAVAAPRDRSLAREIVTRAREIRCGHRAGFLIDLDLAHAGQGE